MSHHCSQTHRKPEINTHFGHFCCTMPKVMVNPLAVDLRHPRSLRTELHFLHKICDFLLPFPLSLVNHLVLVWSFPQAFALTLRQRERSTTTFSDVLLECCFEFYSLLGCFAKETRGQNQMPLSLYDLT